MWAWLNTAPHVERKQAISGKRVQTPTRLQKMRADRDDPDFTPEMPDSGPAAHLIDYLWEAGPSMLVGQGTAAPLTHAEIQGWQANTGVELCAWEVTTLRSLSAAYLEQVQEARDPQCPSPTAPPEMTEEDRKRVDNSLRDALRSMMRSTRKKAA